MKSLARMDTFINLELAKILNLINYLLTAMASNFLKYKPFFKIQCLRSKNDSRALIPLPVKNTSRRWSFSPPFHTGHRLSSKYYSERFKKTIKMTRLPETFSIFIRLTDKPRKVFFSEVLNTNTPG